MSAAAVKDARTPPEVLPVQVEAVAADGRAAMIEVRSADECIEFWRGEQRCAVLDRAVLRSWLNWRRGVLTQDSVVFSVDASVRGHGRVVLTVTGGERAPVRDWTLSPSEELKLMRAAGMLTSWKGTWSGAWV